MNILSSNIKIYPSSLRSDDIDRNARLTSEQNLISVINRLSDKDSFIISGLTVSGNTITKGQCSIHGYYFDILNDIDISELADANDLYLGIRTINRKSETGNDIDFIQLAPYSRDEASTSLDLDSQGANSQFLGLSILSTNKDPAEDASTYYYLHLATKTNGNWVSDIKSLFKFNVNKIFYNKNNISISFIDWLNTDFGLDDGEIN